MTTVIGAAAESEETGSGAIGFLSAVQRVIQSSRPSTEADLLCAAACQFLHRCHRANSDDIRLAVSEIWPGSQPSRNQIDAALCLAKELRLVAIDESAEWFLTPEGLADVQRHSQLVTGLRERVMADLRIRSREGLRYEPDSDEAKLWLNQLIKALIVGIEKSQAAYLGEVEQLIQGRIAPREVNSSDILSYLDGIGGNTEVVELLKSLALAALDPLDPFGKELVSLITTGCILHSYVSGRSGAEITSQIGSPAGQRAILDTPVLLSLVGRKADRDDTELTIRSAAAVGWDVVVCKHSLDELHQLLRREIPEVIKRVQEANERNTRVEFYAALVEDQIHGICIAALKDGTYKNLHEMLATCERLEEDLISWGANVREHGNEISPDRVAKCVTALQGQLDKGPRSGRSARVIERDANTMAMAWRRRSREQSGNWPGAWIISSDRQMAPAYASVSSDRVSLTLSLPQWTTVVSISAPVEDLQGLATAAAGQFAEEAMWQLPARFPADFAMGLAAQLSPNRGGSDMDLRHAQMMLSLPEMLDELEAQTTSTAIAAVVLADRTKRVDAMMQQEKERQNDALARATVEASEAQQVALKARVRELEVEQEKADLAGQLERSRAEKAALDKELADTKRRSRRVLWSIALCALTAIFPVIEVLTNNGLGTLIGIVSFAAMVTIATRWCRDLALAIPVLVWTAIVDCVGLVSALLPVFGVAH